MTNRDDEIAVLVRGLDQAAALLGSVDDDDLDRATPCQEWTTAELVGHLVAAPANFAQMMRGEDVDWSATTPYAGTERVDVFRSGADELLGVWRDIGDGEAPIGPDWQSAEMAVHSYDLATALGRPTADLDPAVAERGLAFMQAMLKPEIRGDAFGPEQPAPEGADPYQRIAAFAGRPV